MMKTMTVSKKTGFGSIPRLLYTIFIFAVFIVLLPGCSGDDDQLMDKSFHPSFYNCSKTELNSTQRFVSAEVGPKDIISEIVVDTLRSNMDVATQADECFEYFGNLYVKKYNTNLFSQYGVLLYVTPENSLIQIRVGKKIRKYLMMRGVIAGSEYIAMQQQAVEQGVDQICPVMTKKVWKEIENLQNMNFIEKGILNISLSWVGDILYDIGNPTESLSSGFAIGMARVVGRVAGKTHSMLFTICLLALIVWIVNLIIDKLFYPIPERDKPTMLIGHVNSLVFILKVIVSAIIVTPAFATFTFFSNMRTEDILFLQAHDMPFLETIDWATWSAGSTPLLLLVMVISILYFLNYILTPHRLLAYYLMPSSLYYLLYENHTLSNQCASITRKGKWEFIMFLGVVAIYALCLLWLLVKYLIFFVIAVIGWLFYNGELDITSLGGFKASGNILKSLTEEISINNDDDSTDESNHLNETIAGIGLSEAIAQKMPRSFFILPFDCTFRKVFKEGAILSVILAIVAPFILSKALIAFFIAFYTVRLVIHGILEIWYSYKLRTDLQTHLAIDKLTGDYNSNRTQQKKTLRIIIFLLLLSAIGVYLLSSYSNNSDTSTTTTIMESDKTPINPDDIVGLYFVTKADGVSVKGETARISSNKDGNYYIQIYSDKPMRRFAMQLDIDNQIFHCDILGDGYITYDKQTKSITINFSDLWILTN